jgi:hypothetical protein
MLNDIKFQNTNYLNYYHQTIIPFTSKKHILIKHILITS